MKVSWRARIREGTLAGVALVALISVLFAADIRLRDRARYVVDAASPSNIAQTSGEVTAHASRLVRNVRDEGTQHLQLTGFLTVAGVLLLFMLKT